jgi:hypothetical protein
MRQAAKEENFAAVCGAGILLRNRRDAITEIDERWPARPRGASRLIASAARS